MRDSLRRLILAVLCLAASVSFIVFMGLYFFVKPISEKILHSAGFPQAEIRSASFGFKGSILEDVRLSDKLSLGRVELYAMPSDLLAGRLGAIVLNGVSAEWPFLPASQKSDGPLRLPAASITVSQADIAINSGERVLPLAVTAVIETTDRGIKAQADIDVQGGQEGTYNVQGKAKITAQIPADGKNAQIVTELSDTHGDFDGTILKRIGGWINLDLRQQDWSVASVNAQISSGAGRITQIPFADATATFSFDGDKANALFKAQLNNDAGFIDLSLSDIPDGTQRQVSAKGKATLKNLSSFGVKDLSGRGSLDFSFTGARQAGPPPQDLSAWQKLNGNLALSANALSLPGVLKNSETAVKADLTFDPATGRAVFILPPFSWKDDRFNAALNDARITLDKTMAGQVSFKDLRLAFGETVIDGLGGDIGFKNLSPLVITKQKLTARKLYAGLPLENGTLTFSIADKGKITLHDSRWDMAGGTLDIEPFSWSPAAEQTQVTLKATDISLPLLFQIVPLDGLGAEGRVSGEIPLRIGKGGELQIDNASLQNIAAGKLTYNPADPPAFLKDDGNPQISLLRDALKDFGFDLLKMSFSGDLGGTQKVTLNLQGRNPQLYDGRQINLNLNVEGPLQSVLEYNPAGTKITDDVQRLLDKNRTSK